MEESTEVQTEITENEVITETEVKTFTQEDINKIINKTIAKERKKAEEEKSEAEKLAKMSEAEKQQALFEKQKAEFEKERASYLKEKLELQVVKELSQKSLPTEFSRYLIGVDAEECLANITEFETTFNSALEKLVNERLKGTTPQVAKTTTGGISKEQFKKMGMVERQKLYIEDRELYMELSK